MRSTIDFEQEILNYLKKHSDDDIPPTVREIAAEVGIKSTSTVHKYLGILEEKGYITKRDGLNRTVKLTEKTMEKQGIPIVGTIAAGNPILAFEETIGFLPCNRESLEGLFALKVRGESMVNAGILDGDIVVARRTSIARNGEIVVALIEEEATVKRFFKEDGHYRLQPENANMQPIYVDHVQILGKVLSAIRIFED